MFDQFILTSSGVSCLIFAVVQVMVFRFTRAAHVLKGLMNIYWVSAVLNLGITFLYGRSVSVFEGLGPAEVGFCMALSFFLYSLMTLLYVLFIFGPYESSVRLRVVQELDRYYPQSCSLDTLLSAYNAEVVLKRRLDRLVTAGDIVSEGGVYRLKKKVNFFLLANYIAEQLGRLMTVKKDAAV